MSLEALRELFRKFAGAGAPPPARSSWGAIATTSLIAGLIVAGLHFLGPDWWSAGLAVGLAIALMKATRTVHPPASSNPLIVFAFKPGWGFLLFPTLTGAVLIVVIALFVHNLRRPTRWPQYW